MPDASTSETTREILATKSETIGEFPSGFSSLRVSLMMNIYGWNLWLTWNKYKVIFSYVCMCVYIHIYRCPRRKGPNFGRVYLRSNYTDITQNTYIQSSMVTEILNIEKWGLVWCLRTILCPWRHICRIRSCIPTLSLDAAHCDLGWIRCSQCIVVRSEWSILWHECDWFGGLFDGFMSLTSYFDVKYRY